MVGRRGCRCPGCGRFRVGSGLCFHRSELRSEHADPGTRVPPDLMVVVSTSGKTFHGSAKCEFIHGREKLQTLAAREAIQKGYTPCVRCMKKYLIA
jgi:hypothetical protein